MNHSLAAVFEGKAAQISLRELKVPEPTGTEILTRVVGCTLCGSDIHSFEGRRSVPVPTVLGHEIVGEIVEFGELATRADLSGRELRIGDRITWAIVAHCGDCSPCHRGLPQKCLNGVKYGHEPFLPGRELLGGLAEHCLLVAGTSIVRLPEDLPLAVACPASCATATIAAALEAAGDLLHKNIVIFGAGMLGLTACAMARSRGAAEITCVDPLSARRELARSFGATHSISPEDLQPKTAGDADHLPNTLSSSDIILELSGSPNAFHAAWPLLRTGGTLVLVGSVFPSTPVPIALEQIVRRHLTIRGIHNYAPRHLVTAVEFLSGHHRQFPFAELVTDWYSLKAISEAFANSTRPNAIRIGVRPD